MFTAARDSNSMGAFEVDRTLLLDGGRNENPCYANGQHEPASLPVTSSPLKKPYTTTTRKFRPRRTIGTLLASTNQRTVKVGCRQGGLSSRGTGTSNQPREASLSKLEREKRVINGNARGQSTTTQGLNTSNRINRTDVPSSHTRTCRPWLPGMVL